MRKGHPRQKEQAGAKSPCKVWLDHRVGLGPGTWAPGRHLDFFFLGPGVMEEY